MSENGVSATPTKFEVSTSFISELMGENGADRQTYTDETRTDGTIE